MYSCVRVLSRAASARGMTTVTVMRRSRVLSFEILEIPGKGKCGNRQREEEVVAADRDEDPACREADGHRVAVLVVDMSGLTCVAT